MTFWAWSRTASSNANADTTVNWAEGMAPSAVNDSARAMMTAAAKYRDDVAGAIVTTGTSTAYALASNQVFDTLAHMNGAMLAFVPHATNGGACTLNVDGLGARALRMAPGGDVPAGTLIQGTPYAATYNSAAAEWYLHGVFGNPYNIPVGGLIAYSGSTAPNSSFVLPSGQAISRTAYAGYFALVGTSYGPGDGTTTFNVPDLRGRVVAGLDNMGGAPAGRVGTVATDGGTIVGTTLGSAGGSATHVLVNNELPAGNTAAISVAYGTRRPPVELGGAQDTTRISLGDLGASLGPDVTSNPASVSLPGGGAAMSLIQPTLLMTYILRII
jgi:microcystin-dependent protein